MDISQVAAQLYTVRDHTKTAADLGDTFRKLAGIGYRAVQLTSLDHVPEDETAKMLGEAGLTACSSHESPDRILSHPRAIADRMRKYGATHVACPSPGSATLDTLDDVKAFAARLSAAGRAFQEAGIILGYHNHSFEFRRFDGRLMLDVLYREADPRYLQAELDTYWIQHGGGDPEDWCRALKGRLPSLHLKDYKIGPDSRPTFAEIGRGNLNWKPIIAAADDSGCRWFIVEQDRCDGDPFDSLRISFDYIKGNLCS